MKVEDLESRLTLATFTMVYDVGIEVYVHVYTYNT